ncbi:hypothetical protein CNR22_12160 [Sphingobacteriaceae bacterium]|nr:hypothetical protein CNR22_12160 [Sphingobacteriaceae bacterium]
MKFKTPSTMNTLIIDDDLFLKKALSFNLLDLGHVVAVAGDGQEAIQMIEKNQNFDLIFCDVMMPVLTGPAFLLMLKKYFPKNMPCIVIISGVKEGEEFLKKTDIQYDYFVKKPIDMPALRKLIGEISNSKQS